MELIKAGIVLILSLIITILLNMSLEQSIPIFQALSTFHIDIELLFRIRVFLSLFLCMTETRSSHWPPYFVHRTFPDCNAYQLGIGRVTTVVVARTIHLHLFFDTGKLLAPFHASHWRHSSLPFGFQYLPRTSMMDFIVFEVNNFSLLSLGSLSSVPLNVWFSSPTENTSMVIVQQNFHMVE